jgi:hypothetical protein
VHGFTASTGTVSCRYSLYRAVSGARSYTLYRYSFLREQSPQVHGQVHGAHDPFRYIQFLTDTVSTGARAGAGGYSLNRYSFCGFILCKNRYRCMVLPFIQLRAMTQDHNRKMAVVSATLHRLLSAS